MMYASSPAPWVAIVWMLHASFSIIAALGVLFFVVWAVKHLSVQKLKSLWIWFLVIGIIGSLLTCPILLGIQNPFGGREAYHRFDKNGEGMMQNMLEQMQRNGMMQNDVGDEDQS
jgi:hypothetical protein